jgi:DNA-binding transcriptional regulator YdaS (Cro superfamily)
MPVMDNASPIDRAIALAGSEARLGEATGFSQVAINKAKRRGQASAEMALAIHRFTEGAVAASELRPDLWSRAADVATAPTAFPESAPLPADRRSAPLPADRGSALLPADPRSPPKPRPPSGAAATVTNSGWPAAS